MSLLRRTKFTYLVAGVSEIKILISILVLRSIPILVVNCNVVGVFILIGKNPKLIEPHSRSDTIPFLSNTSDIELIAIYFDCICFSVDLIL